MSDDLLLEVKDHIAVMTLNRPEALNAFTPELMKGWVAGLDEIQADDDVRVLLVTGAGRGFSSGGDVKRMGEGSDNTPFTTKDRLWKQTQSVAKRMAQFDKPAIAAINGVAVGGGLDLALTCDIRVAAESARLAETYARIGLLPGAGGAWYLPRIVGRAKALEMLWTCEFLTARDALDIGLVSHVWPDDEFMDQALAFAGKIAAGAPMSNRFIKRTLDQGLNADLTTHLDQISSHIAVVRASEDHIEGIKALKEKRAPKFKGR
ncbi:MAG: enoyl-CoA hydratase-related protein [Alphaproteobacteria bacterium]|nr:enoyl-CoA hydratase-related protein [Alphaproteobacteria bacterium]